MSETSTESLDEELAHVTAGTYGDGVNDSDNDVAPEDSPDEAGTNAGAATPDTRAETGSNAQGSTDLSPSPSSEAPSDSSVASSVTGPPDNWAPDNCAPSAPPHGPGAVAPETRGDPHNLRLRVKVWTDPGTLKRYLMPTGFMRDLVNGLPVSDVMYAYGMRDDDTKLVVLSALEWNALPFFYFREDGAAPRATARAGDTLP